MRERYGEGMDEHLRTFFARAGLEYDPPERIPNSRNALRVTELARDRGLHQAVHDRLMDAFWSEGRDLGEEAVLRELATQAGLDAAEIDAVLAGDAYLERVVASTKQAQAIGINGIPAWLLDERLLVSGAQPRDVFERAFAELEAA